MKSVQAPFGVNTTKLCSGILFRSHNSINYKQHTLVNIHIFYKLMWINRKWYIFVKSNQLLTHFWYTKIHYSRTFIAFQRSIIMPGNYVNLEVNIDMSSFYLRLLVTMSQLQMIHTELQIQDSYWSIMAFRRYLRDAV